MTKNKSKKYKRDFLSSNVPLGGLKRKSNDILINKFVNLLSHNGKKSNSYKLLLKSLAISKSRMLSSTGFAESRNGSLKYSNIPEFSTLKERYKKIQKNTNKVTFDTLEERKHCKPFFHQAIGHIKPSVETRQVRGGGTVYQVPSIIHNLRQEGIAMRWLIMSAAKRLPIRSAGAKALTGLNPVRNTAQSSLLRTDSGKKGSGQLDFSNRLSQELLSSFQKEGQSRQKRDQTHILAANNRAYVRYRWW